MIKRVTVCVVIVFMLFALAPRAGAATTKPTTTRTGATRRAATTPSSAASLDALLEPIRAKHKLPGLAAAIVEGDEVIAIGATGLRKVGAPEPITIDDKLHLGSCTKAMTATVLARLIERKQLAWDSTISQIFPDLAPKFDEAYRDVTLEQLLQHRAGLPANAAWASLGAGTNNEQRVRLLKLVLAKAPELPPGTKYSYSNVGYVIAAAMGERVTKRSWEQLIKTELFDPLGMTSAGFGPPGAKGKVDEPWGHLGPIAVVTPVQGDNPPSLGPAGRVHCTIGDWGKFVSLHLRGARGEETKYLTKETFERLHRPPEGGEYAAGWIIDQRKWADGTVFTHAGSNTMWYCVVWAAPKKNFAVLSVTNFGGSAAAQACDDASGAMIAQYAKLRPGGKVSAALPGE
jgi:CubicO group peptidase (beta-lactamase class C family)